MHKAVRWLYKHAHMMLLQMPIAHKPDIMALIEPTPFITLIQMTSTDLMFWLMEHVNGWDN